MPDNQKAAVLVVDDDPDNIDLMEGTLAELPAEIVTAGSGAEAVRLAAERRFAVILMDLRMPRMSGLEAAEEIDRGTLNRDTPIIFCTGMTDDKSVLSGYRAGAVDYLLKSENPEIIRRKTQVFLDLYQRQLELTEAHDKLEITMRNLRHHRDHLQDMVESRTERLREAMRQAEMASRAKSNFLSNMSHELRTPINGILGMAQLLAASKLTSEQEDQLETINTSTQLLLDIVSQILEIAQLESGQVEVREEAVNPVRLCEQIVAVARAAVVDKPVTVECQAGPAVRDWYRTDRARLRQILMTFLDNATQFTARGSIRVSVEAKPAGDRDTLRFTVADTGTGIAKNELDTLFEKFTQADESSRRAHGGLGLGLARAKEVATLLGGRVGGESTPGTGSRFWFEISLPPCDAPGGQPAAPAKADVAAPAPGHCNVLVAEDNPVNQKVAGKMLEKLGCSVTIAENGARAVELYKEGRFDLVLMDCHMPVMDGFGAAREIRCIEDESGNGRPRVPIIALTADVTEGVQERCQEAGMDDYLSKPVPLASLKAILGKIAPAGAKARQ